MSDHADTKALIHAIDQLREQNERLTERVDDLEHNLEQTEDRVETLETENEQLRDRLEDCEHETTRIDALTDAARKRSGVNKQRIEELQARELEKGAHLLAETVDHCEIDVDGDRLEQLTKDDGQTYYRVPQSEDPLERGGSITLSHGDLLPIQQLARMDDEMLRSTSNALPTRLAAKLWKARTDSSIGDNPWERGCKDIAEYVKASDLKHWIRRQEPGTSDTYAKKLVSRTIDAMLDLSKNRVAIRKRTERKNGLEYTERRLILPEDVDIPGETLSQPTEAPETAGVRG
ncbi:hypothetical protein [Natronorubrum sulfidifaciens]|uniref:Uncharacterized protein n=1 Tax=Natronorubrum sulfidifaciens JCM 14089 TaxID=1230460 RepID=L9W8M4_9EURY|nr:hypothetical protein [Natronorubrum sulfidifaciens]ELY45601.1 hypothetical protein C495_08110 [Natronorubrum sulfidifaciens JCM 14089]